MVAKVKVWWELRKVRGYILGEQILRKTSHKKQNTSFQLKIIFCLIQFRFSTLVIFSLIMVMFMIVLLLVIIHGQFTLLVAVYNF